MYTGTLGGISNAEDWNASFSLLNLDNTPFIITGARILMRLCREGNSSTPLLQAQTDDNSILIGADASSFSWDVPETTMNNLRPEVYNVFVRMLLNGGWTQLISGTLTVIDGGPSS